MTKNTTHTTQTVKLLCLRTKQESNNLLAQVSYVTQGDQDPNYRAATPERVTVARETPESVRVTREKLIVEGRPASTRVPAGQR